MEVSKIIPIFAYTKTRDNAGIIQIRRILFFFFSREHEPIHVHVEGNGGKVIYDIVDGELIQREIYNIKPNDLKRIKRFAQLNIEIIIDEWNDRFGKKED